MDQLPELESDSPSADYFERYIDCFNISISSFGFLINFYPIYDKLRPSIRSPATGRMATLIALSVTAMIYIFFAYLAISNFGIDQIKQNVFENLA